MRFSVERGCLEGMSLLTILVFELPHEAFLYVDPMVTKLKAEVSSVGAYQIQICLA